MATIELDRIGKRYPDGTEAVRDLNLEIADGEFVVLVGPSGCGKTTALRMIAGLEEITSGELRIDDRVVNGLPAKSRDIAMVFQDYALYPHMSVRKNLAFSLRLRKTSRDEIDRRVSDAAKILGLVEYLDRKPAQLSGGQRQRVAMGRAIVREPSAFLLDEPLSNLDAKLRVQMRAEILRLQRRLGATMVFVTHDQTEALTLGDRIAVMRKGVLQQVGSPRDVYAAPVNLFVAGFIGSPAMNFLPGEFSAGVVRTPIGEVPVGEALRRRVNARRPDGGKVIVGIRSESFEDATLVDAARPGHLFEAPVELVESVGSDIYAHVAVPNGGLRGNLARELLDDAVADGADGERPGEGRLVVRLAPASRISEGERARLWVDSAALHLFDEAGESLLPAA